MKTIQVVTLILISLNLFAQDYTSYYKRCNNADSLAYLGLDQQALDTLEAAFSTVDYVHSQKYMDAYYLAIDLGYFDKAFEFGKRAIINSGKKRIVRKGIPWSFRRSSYYSTLKDSSDYYLERYKSRVNVEFQQIIDSLHYVDQRVIRKNRKVRGQYAIDKDELPENLFQLDNSNWLTFHACVQKFGFPSEENVGSDSYNNTMVLLIHNLRNSGYEKYHAEYFDYIKKGDYLPRSIILWYEQYNMHVLGRTFFTTWDKNTSEENIKRLDRNRRKFFLKGMNSIKLSGNGRIMRSLW